MKRNTVLRTAPFLLSLAVLVPTFEEIYRAYVFIPSVKSGMMNWPIIEGAVSDFTVDSDIVEYYFASGVLAQSCARSDLGCFEWEEYPNVSTVITESAGLISSPAVLLFRDCPTARECVYLNDYQTFAVALDRQEFLELLSARTTESNCTEVKVPSTAITPVVYRTQYCSDVNILGDQITSINVYSKIGQPYYAMALSDIWYRSELSATLDFGRRSVAAGKGWSVEEVLEAGNE